MENQKKDFSGMFSNIVEKANKTMNSKLSKKIKINLLVWGCIVALLGVAAVIIGLYLAISQFSAIGITINVNVGAIIGGCSLFIVGGLMLGIGGQAIRAGLAIIITGIATDVLDTNVYCPVCHDKVDPNEMYCNKCGANLRANKLCECGEQNDVNDKFCRKCGKPLK